MRGRGATRGGRARWLVLLAVVATWYVTIAPSALGGPMTPVLTRGVSMEPTLHAGDLAIGFRDRSPEVGDVLIARHPSGPLVVHRMIGRDDAGIITQGDNIARPDHWRTAPEDVVGTVRWTIPGSWRVIAVLIDPWTMGALAAVIVVAAAGLTADVRSRRRRIPVSAALLIPLMGGVGLVPGFTASFELTSDQLLVLTDTAPLDTYLVTPGNGNGGGNGGGGGGGGGGNGGGKAGR